MLIYVEEKKRAFREFHRVLRPGGRISLFEPINRFGMEERRRTWVYDVETSLIEKLNAVYDEIQPRTDPMLDFDERDLLELETGRGVWRMAHTYLWAVKP